MSIKRNYKKLVGNSEFEKYEMKNSLEGLNDRLELVEETISKFVVRLIEIMHSEEQKRVKNNEQNLREM